MAGSTREIRRRIRSIGNTRKVTKAMELVASAKMRRTVQAVLATRPYAQRAWKILVNLGLATHPESHPLLRQGGGSRIGVVLISTNRGLVGGFNANLINETVRALQREDPSHEHTELVLLGKRGRAIVSKYGYRGAAEFEKLDVVTRADDVRPVAKLIIDDFKAGTYDRVIVAYMDFVSTLKQRPRIRQILPILRDPALGALGEGENGNGNSTATVREYLFEPNADDILESVLPRLVEMQLYQAVLESNASEHAARMVAMKNATEAAGDLMDDLTLTYNQARQAAITQDLSEISASRAALGS